MQPNLKRFAADPLAFFESLVIPSAHGPKRFGDVMGDYQRDWFKVVASALLAIAAGEQPDVGRFWAERTKGASKDSDIALVLLWLLAFCIHKLDMIVGAADRDQALELKKAACDVLRLNPWLSARIEVQTWTLLCKATGSECNIVAADVAGSHGSRPDVVVLNELSHIPDGKEEFAQNLLDNASKKPHGLVIVASNAGFTGSWQARWRAMAETSDRWHFHQFAQPAPWLSDDELAEAQRRNSRSRYNRLFWGVWVSQSGDALDADDIQAAVTSSRPPTLSQLEGSFFAAGLDLGIKQDHSALVVLAASRETLQLKLAYAQSWKPDPQTGKVDLIAVERAVLDAHKRFGLRKVGFDPYQAQLMAQRLELQRVPMHEMTFTGANLNLMASTLLDVFRSRRIELFNHPQLVRDLGRLFIEEKSYGHRLSATKDESGHADLATALAIALPLAVDQAGRVPVVVGRNAFDCDGLTPFERELRRIEAENQHRQWLSEQPDDHQQPFRDFMRLQRRI